MFFFLNDRFISLGSKYIASNRKDIKISIY